MSFYGSIKFFLRIRNVFRLELYHVISGIPAVIIKSLIIRGNRFKLFSHTHHFKALFMAFVFNIVSLEKKCI